MKEETKLTKRALESLKAYHIEEKDILLSSPIDLSFEGRYINGYIVLTKDRIFVCTMELPEKSVTVFRSVKDVAIGYEFPEEAIYEYDVTEYELKELEHIHIERYIGTNGL